MVTTAITKGNQNKVVGKMSASRVGLCTNATIKENNTIYHQGPKKQPSPLKEPGCTQVFINKEREVSASRSTKRYKIMKNFSLLLMLLAVLTVFNGCQKDEPVLVDEQLQEVVKPDVYAENGYLVFKDINTVDSIILVLGGLNQIEKEAWERQFSYVSARSQFDALFDEYEKLSSIDEFNRFKERNRGKLRFNDFDPEDNSIDYPFVTELLVPVLNSNGLVKIGTSLSKFTDEDQIVVLDGDFKKLNNIEKYAESGEVLLLPKLKSTINDYMYTDFPTYNPYQSNYRWYEKTSDRRLLNELRVERIYLGYYINTNNQQVHEYRLSYLLKQRAQKRSWGHWNDYKTDYSLAEAKAFLNNELRYCPSKLYSPEVRPAAYFKLFTFLSAYTWHGIGTFQHPPFSAAPFSFSGKTSCRGFGYEDIFIMHSMHSGFPGMVPGPLQPCPPSWWGF
jgi:hypothetical protein